MAQEIINLGIVANDGTGDTVRDAGTKINANFTELYNPALRRRRFPVWEIDFATISNTQTPFQGTAILSGTQNGSPSTHITSAHPGVLVIASSTSANSGYRYTTDIESIMIGGGEQFDFVFKTPGVFTGTTLRCGFLDSVNSNDAVDGAYLEFSGSGAIVGKTSNNSTRTTSATIATLSASTWYHAQARINNAASQVTFEIFNDAGVSQGAQVNTTNIPTTRGTGCGFVVTNSGTTAVDLLYPDYMSAAWLKDLARGALN